MRKLNYFYENLDQVDYHNILKHDVMNSAPFNLFIASTDVFYQENKKVINAYVDVDTDEGLEKIQTIMGQVKNNLCIKVSTDVGYEAVSKLHAKLASDSFRAIRECQSDVRDIWIHIDVEDLDKLEYVKTGVSIGRPANVYYYIRGNSNISKDLLDILEANCTVLSS